MPAEVQTGKAVLYGISNDGTQISIPGFATFILDMVKGGHKFKLTAIEDENDADAALIATNAHLEIDITFTAAGATRAAAAATAVFLTPLSSLALNHFKVSAFNGTWIYVGDESIDLSHGVAKISLKVRKYDDSTQNTSLAATVSG